MKVAQLNLKTGRFDENISDVGSMFCIIDDDGVSYNIAKRKGQEGITIHISDGGRALCVFPQAANSITIKASDYV